MSYRNNYNNNSNLGLRGLFGNNNQNRYTTQLDPQVVNAAATIVASAAGLPTNSTPYGPAPPLGPAPPYGSNNLYNSNSNAAYGYNLQPNGLAPNGGYGFPNAYEKEEEEYPGESFAEGGAKKKTKKSKANAYADDKPKAKKATKKTSPKKSAPKTKKTGGSPNPYRRR
jgi:hypothetical protein